MINRQYYSSGQLWYKREYQGDQWHGIQKGWHENGQLCYEESYHEGQAHGITKWWHQSGQLWYKEYYLYGNQVTEEEYRRHELIVKLSGL